MITVLEKPIPFGGGILLPSNKAVSLEHPVKKAKLPEVITIPLRQHIGLPAEVIVKPGDKVFKGQVIASPHGYVSAPIHASTSGVVKEIAEHPVPNPSGVTSYCIVIEADGEDKWLEERTVVDDYYSLNPIQVQQRIFESGIVGLGGAGFPSAVKLIPGLTLDIELLILNACECEPYISCDEALIRNNVKDIIKGFEILAHALQVDECVIAIEDNKTEAISILQEGLKQYTELEIQLVQVSSLYPAGGEKQLIKSITGLEVPAEGLPVDIGVVCYNVGTAMAVKKAIMDAEPLISRIVTVTGPGISEPGNLDVLIGTPIAELIEQSGGYNDQFEYLIMGGPMMGFKLFSDKVPVIKTTNCLLAAGAETQVKDIKESHCIRCDECATVCPASLQPQQLHWYSKEFNPGRLEDYRLFDCIECGCCSYVCPSYIPLVEEYRQAKHRIWDIRKREREAKQNRQRYLDKLDRLEQREKEKNRQRQDKLVQKDNERGTLQSRQDEIAAAVQRVREKRKLNENNSTD